MTPLTPEQKVAYLRDIREQIMPYKIDADDAYGMLRIIKGNLAALIAEQERLL